MYCRCLPENFSILGYARSKLSKKDLQEKVKPNLKGDKSKIDEFLDKLDYEAGAYDKPEGFQKVRHGQLACLGMPVSASNTLTPLTLPEGAVAMKHASSYYLHFVYCHCPFPESQQVSHAGAQNYI